MEYRINANELFHTVEAWDALIPGRGRIRLIACGGTALTLLGYKDSTKDVDLLVPDAGEYLRLVRFLGSAGYDRRSGFGWQRPGEAILFDIYPGKKVYTTELLTTPLRRGGNRKIRSWKKIYLGVLDPTDLIISKMFRGTLVDIEDSLVLIRRERPDLRKMEKRYRETAKYETNETRVLRNYEILMKHLKG
ncbi:MAG TPA: hypothetical protein PLO78_06580 [Candidatus Omnitrophota bacterium]|nr:hypothetical protein [Candidatus Omnitrophota bacterium]